jgi:YidC/Oxa1 family membrane protein insertase
VFGRHAAAKKSARSDPKLRPCHQHAEGQIAQQRDVWIDGPIATMPSQPNRVVRLLVPIAIGILGGFLVWAVFTKTKPAQPAPSQPAPEAQAATPAAGDATAVPASTEASTQPSSTPQAPAAQPTANATPAPTPTTNPIASPEPSVPIASLSAKVFAAPSAALTVESDDVLVALSPVGGGVERITLKNRFDTIRKQSQIIVQNAPESSPGLPSLMVPFAAVEVEVTLPTPAGQAAPAPIRVPLYANTAGVHWRTTETAGELEAIIIDQRGGEVLRVVRSFTADGYNVDIRQRIENLSGLPLSARMTQYGPIDPPLDNIAYGGDMRRLRFGAMMPQNLDPAQRSVTGDYHIEWRRNALAEIEPLFNSDGTPLLGPDGKQLKGYVPLSQTSKRWPDETATSEGQHLVWMGLTSRYWGIAAGPLSAPDATGSAKQLAWVESVHTHVPGGTGTIMGLMLRGKALPLAPTGLAGSSQQADMRLFAGPLDRSLIASDAWRASVAMKDLVIYNFGGPCGPCTFQGLANSLLGLLRFLHNSVFFDWAMAIIMLVVIVRTLLHPVTKWSQIRMARFGKQMGAIAPKQKELQEKYKSDPAKLREETARLWSQEGVSPTGMLGCIPMFLQMPVWLALSAALYFSVELRHQGAFWGVFQAIQPQSSPFWQFLGDLSEPDRLIYFGKTIISLPILGDIRSINILPVLLGIVFFAQQKYMAPTTGPMTPEQELQMKMFKWMSVFLFPLFMYQAPSGLAIYFLANSALAIIEGKWIRHQMEKHGMLDLDKMKAERQQRKKGNQMGFLEKMQKIAAEQEQKRKAAVRNKK